MARHLPAGMSLRYVWENGGIGTSDYFEFANAKWFRASGFAVVDDVPINQSNAYLSGKRLGEESPEFWLPANAHIYSATLILPSPIDVSVESELFLGWQDDISSSSTPILASSSMEFAAGTYRPESQDVAWTGIVDIVPVASRIYIKTKEGLISSEKTTRVGIAVDFYLPGSTDPLYDEIVFGYE